MPSHTKEIEQIMDDIQMTNTEQILKEFQSLMSFSSAPPLDAVQMHFVETGLRDALHKQKQQILDAVERGKIKVTNNWEYTHDRDDDQYTKLSKEEVAINKGIDKALSIIKNA